MSPIKSLATISSAKSVRNLEISDIYKNNTMNNVALFILLALSVGYFMNKHYRAFIFLYVFAVISFLLCKDLFIALMISIILTNLLITVDFFKTDATLEGMKKSEKNPEKEFEKFKDLAVQLKNIQK